MNDETYLHNLRMRDKYTKRPTIWELAQTFSDCRALACARLMVTENQPAIRWYKKFLRLTKPESLETKLDVMRAKSYPIQELYDFNVSRETSKRIQTKCPFHDEKVGSFYIFKDQNRYHCFSCSSSGDSIDFIRNLYDYNFIDAVNYLNGR